MPRALTRPPSLALKRSRFPEIRARKPRHGIEELNLMLRKWRLGTMAAKRSGTRLWKRGAGEGRGGEG